MNIYKIMAYLVAVLLISVGSVTSVQRIISSTNDNLYTFIRNSNGRYWEATSVNIQVAINDLDNNSGRVWLPGNKTFWLTDTVIVWENIILDMQGSEFKHPSGVNCHFVELKDGAGVKNGVIDAANFQGVYQTNNSFNISSAAIYLNATSYIDSALIENMFLESIASDYHLGNGYTPSNGSGYGIYLHATDVDVPQRISNVTATNLYLRCFHTGIYLQNERSNTGINTSYIDGNSFEHVWIYANSYSINLSRNTNADKVNCSVSRNLFDDVQFQTGHGHYYGGHNITWNHLRCDGTGNRFEDWMAWDWTNGRGQIAGNPEVWFTSDSEFCYIMGRGTGYDGTITGDHLDEGKNNTILSAGWSELRIGDVSEEPGQYPPLPPPPPEPQFNYSNWSYYKIITINSSYVDGTGNHTNFPILFSNTSSDFILTNGKVQGDGDDFVFTLADNVTILNHEIEKFDNSTGELVAWVNITSLNCSSDTVIHLFYGNSTCSNKQNVAGTWSSDYLGVWHMRNDSGMVYDSTSNDIDGTLVYGGPEDNLICNESGKIGYSLDLWNWYESGSSGAYVDLNDIDTTLNNDTYSVLAWARTRNLGDSNYSYYKTVVHFTAINNWQYERFILQQSRAADGTPHDDFYVNSDSCYDMDMGSYDNNWWMDKNNTWRFFYVTHNYTAQLARCYFNTTDYWEDTSLLQNFSDIDYLRFGAHVSSSQSYNFNGSIDEVRIEKVDRSRAWVNTTYNNMEFPELFLTIGDEQNV